MQAETKKQVIEDQISSDEDLFNPRQRRAAGVLFFSFPAAYAKK